MYGIDKQFGIFEEMLAVFNGIIQKNAMPPDDWQMNRIQVIFKKGEANLPENYRPISLIQLIVTLPTAMYTPRIDSDSPR